MADKILIRDLLVRAIIGVNEDERHRPQDVLINVTLEVDVRRAGITDDLGDTADYAALAKRIVHLAESSAFYLVERLATEIARLALDDAHVEAVMVRVEKPRALRYGRSVGVEIHRRRGDL